METPSIEKKPRERVAVYLDPDVWRWLRHRKAETRRPVGEIIESALKPHIDSISTEYPDAQ